MKRNKMRCFFIFDSFLMATGMKKALRGALFIE